MHHFLGTSQRQCQQNTGELSTTRTGLHPPACALGDSLVLTPAPDDGTDGAMQKNEICTGRIVDAMKAIVEAL